MSAHIGEYLHVERQTEILSLCAHVRVFTSRQRDRDKETRWHTRGQVTDEWIASVFPLSQSLRASGREREGHAPRDS